MGFDPMWLLIGVLVLANITGRWFVASIVCGGFWFGLVLLAEFSNYGAPHELWEYLVPLGILLLGCYGYFKKKSRQVVK